MNKKRGFTLIELLVVVLIIGILSAAALPQYQKAVDKSRLAEILVIANGIETAEKSYYMASGQYTEDLESLDIQIPLKPYISARIYPEDGKNVSGWMAQLYHDRAKITLQRYFALPFDQCISYSDRAEQLCKNLGGVFVAQEESHKIYRIAK